GLVVAGVAAATAPAVLGSNHQSPARPGFTGKVQNRVLADTAGSAQASFVIQLTVQADLSKAYGMKDQDARGWYVYRTLKAEAERTQGPLETLLKAHGVAFRSFWAANVIFVEAGGRALVQDLAARPDVGEIEANDASYWLADQLPDLN